jgi:hypothetical protein
VSCCCCQDELPYNDYFEYYGPDYRLHISPSNMENLNDKAYLDGVTAKVTVAWFVLSLRVVGNALLVHALAQLFAALSEIEVAPGVAIQTGAALDTPPISRAVEHSDNADPDKHDGSSLGWRLVVAAVCG